MSVILRFQKGSTVIQTALRDDAFPALLKLVTDYEAAEPQPAAPNQSDPMPEFSIADDTNKKGTEDRISFAKNWLSQHSPAETLTFLGWETFPERILVLGALLEASGNDPGWRNADIDEKFNAARQASPANFARDISAAIKVGMIGTVTPRTYTVTRSGWLKVYEQIIKRQVVGTKTAEQL